jgi:putative ABC transport system ATP-binding protein
MGHSLIITESLTKTYDTGSVEVHALKGVSFRLEKGEFVAVMGPSGSGKSTFLNLLGCLDHPTSGTYMLDGADVSTMTDDQLAGVRSRSIGFVFQGFNLLSRTSAERNIELPLVYTGERRRDKPARALLEAVGMPRRGNHSPNELSGGEQQRVAIARALVNAPAIILADEPTGNLDSSMSDEIMDIFLSLNRAGITILMVTHEESVAAYARRLVKFKDGVIVSDEAVARPRGTNGGDKSAGYGDDKSAGYGGDKSAGYGDDKSPGARTAATNPPAGSTCRRSGPPQRGAFGSVVASSPPPSCGRTWYRPPDLSCRTRCGPSSRYSESSSASAQ